MPFWVYILQSESTDRYYCGQTNNIELRLKEHNDPLYYGTKTTKGFEGPWILIWKEECKDRSDAMALEQTIKKRGMSRYLLSRGLENRSKRSEDPAGSGILVRPGEPDILKRSIKTMGLFNLEPKWRRNGLSISVTGMARNILDYSVPASTE